MILCGFSAVVDSSLAQIWTSNCNLVGYCVTSSADGRSLSVTTGSGVYTSTNYGASWISNNISAYATCLAASADGSNLVLGGSSPGAVYSSTNAGLTWVLQATPPSFGVFNNLRSIACSADGKKVVVALYGTCPIFVSTNSGATWSTNNSPVAYWTSVASSSDGGTLYAISTSLWKSTDSGLTWVSNSATATGTAVVATSSDGSVIVVSGFGGTYVSTNSGASWNLSLPSVAFASVALAADGRKMAGVFYSGNFTSTNSGLTWISNALPFKVWSSVTSSADGSRMVATAQNKGIYTWQETPTTQLNFVTSNNNLELSWTIPSTPFVLQQSPDLIAWSSITNSPSVDLANLRFGLTLSATGTNNFFRLKTP